MTAGGKYSVRHRDEWDKMVLPAMDGFGERFSAHLKASGQPSAASALALAQALNDTLIAIAKQLSDRIADLEGGRDLSGLLDAVSEVEQRLKSAPPMIYRGVFNDGQAYTRGDLVTSGGSMWHCDLDRATAKPGIGKGWTLCVKRGADARTTGE